MNIAMMLALVGALNATAMQGSTTYGGVDGWTVEQRDDGCFMTGFYDPQEDWRQEFTIFVDTQGEMSLVFYDNTWALDAGERGDFNITIARAEDFPGWVDLYGEVVDDGSDGRSILIQFDKDGSDLIRADLFGADAISLDAGDENIISLQIDDNANAFALLAECITKVG